MEIKYGLFRIVIQFIAGLFGIEDPQQYTVMTFNIDNNINQVIPYDWENRKDFVGDFINQYNPDIIAFQEVNSEQLLYLSAYMSEYTNTGIDDKGDGSGAYNPLFFNTYKFQMIDAGNFWLSDTPQIAGSKSRDGSLALVSWIILKNYESKKNIFCINTNFTFTTDNSKQNAEQFLYDFIAGKKAKSAVILCGSFGVNKHPINFKTLTTGDNKKPMLFDSKNICKQQNILPTSTYNAYGKESNSGYSDCIFVNKYVKIDYLEIPHAKIDNEYASDHSPVIINTSIYKKKVTK